MPRILKHTDIAYSCDDCGLKFDRKRDIEHLEEQRGIPEEEAVKLLR